MFEYITHTNHILSNEKARKEREKKRTDSGNEGNKSTVIYIKK